jgi:predicted nucleic acid-binding protein
MALLLDASVWVAAAKTDQRFHPPALSLIDSDEEVAALDLTLFEVSNAIGVKAGEPDKARWMLETIAIRCGERIVRVDPGLLVAALDHAVEYNLTAYDAAYVAVARSNGWTLVSTDFRDLVSKGLAVAPDAAV